MQRRKEDTSCSSGHVDQSLLLSPPRRCCVTPPPTPELDQDMCSVGELTARLISTTYKRQSQNESKNHTLVCKTRERLHTEETNVFSRSGFPCLSAWSCFLSPVAVLMKTGLVTRLKASKRDSAERQMMPV